MAGRTARRAWSAPPRSRHFLRPRFAAEIVRGAAVSRDELVVDIGAGSGRLTAEIARVARRVLAVELDARLASALRGRWPNVAVVEGDATAMALPREPFRVIANLPFARTNELLRLLLDDPKTPLTRADLVVEWGVAIKRAVPWPSSARSVIWSVTYEAVLARRLPPCAFEPAPSVAAGLLVFRRRDEPLVRPEDLAAFGRFVSRGFRHGLGAVAPARARGRAAATAAIPRDIDAYEWAELFRSSGRDTKQRRRPR